MRYLFSLSILFSLGILNIQAQESAKIQKNIPAYYSQIDFAASSADLFTKLGDLVKTTHTDLLSYTPEVWNALKVSDLDPSDSSKRNILLIYGYNDTDADLQNDRTRSKDSNCTSSTGCQGKWNREHVYPKSLATPRLTTSYPSAGTDAHSLRPADTEMNSSRSNRKFTNGSGNSGIVSGGHWYPGDEWKGDVARMMMYMYLRYPTQTPAKGVAISTYTNHQSMPDIFLQWNVEDPVSDFEKQRNDHIASLQGNRNPFIDNPYIATLLWGGAKAEDTFDLSSVLGVEEQSTALFFVPNPVKEAINYDVTQYEFERIYITDLKGALVTEDEDVHDGRVSVPEKSGVYIAVFIAKNSVHTKKIIVN
jgi:endonuclease I